MNSFKNKFPDESKNKVDEISEYIKNYVEENGFILKFLNSCSAPYKGVRTEKFIIICSPSSIETFGDFIYTIFHEIRHEEQMREVNAENPLTGNLEDFEKVFEKYWELEIDADTFAKKKIAELVLKMKIPKEVYNNFNVSGYIENYPSMSKQVKNMLQVITSQINKMREMGIEYNDIADHPIVKSQIDKLEDLF